MAVLLLTVASVEYKWQKPNNTFGRFQCEKSNCCSRSNQSCNQIFKRVRRIQGSKCSAIRAYSKIDWSEETTTMLNMWWAITWWCTSSDRFTLITHTLAGQFYGQAMALFLQAHGHHGATVTFHLVCDTCCVCSWLRRPQFTAMCGKYPPLSIGGRFWTFKITLRENLAPVGKGIFTVADKKKQGVDTPSLTLIQNTNVTR